MAQDCTLQLWILTDMVHQTGYKIFTKRCYLYFVAIEKTGYFLSTNGKQTLLYLIFVAILGL